MSEPLDDMYRDIIMDHFRAPRGKKLLTQVDIASEGSNPACGDELQMQVEMDEGSVKDIHVGCQGCAISVASGSMLAEIIKGRPLGEARRIAELVRRMLKGDDVEFPDDLGDIDSLQGVRQFPVRIKCALLAWVTLIEGLDNFAKGQSKTDTPATTEGGD
jgi:nitrogen fixation NifU-like protein